MAKEFRLPDLGEGIHEGEVLAVGVVVGQQVHEDDIILEVETDKAAVEIPSPFTDMVTDVRVKEGDLVHVGDVMIVFGSGDDNEAVAVPTLEAPAVQAQAQSAAPRSALAAVSAGRGAATEAPYRKGPVPAAPSTRRLARELGVDLHAVAPTGPGGRVTREDVRAHAEGGAHSEGRNVEVAAVDEKEREEGKLKGVSPQTVAVPPLPQYGRAGQVERVPLRSVRRATAKQMALSWSQVPHVSTQDLVDITELEKLRLRYKDEVKARGGALTLTVFVMRALVNALRDFPTFNAGLDMESEEIILKKTYNIGIAVDSERGLLVPNIRDADRKSVFDLSIELRDVATRTREGHAKLEDLQGGTITITNIGALGGTGFAPIINYPEVAILGLARARVQLVAKTVDFAEGDAPATWEAQYEFVPRLMLPIILSFDHRVNDGAEAQRFLNRIIEQLENPERLLLGM
jgi:pyruvate dehydrogenase E2 component (dihydrolipoamide acetyltransferase)